MRAEERTVAVKKWKIRWLVDWPAREAKQGGTAELAVEEARRYCIGGRFGPQAERIDPATGKRLSFDAPVSEARVKKAVAGGGGGKTSSEKD